MLVAVALAGEAIEKPPQMERREAGHCPNFSEVATSRPPLDDGADALPLRPSPADFCYTTENIPTPPKRWTRGEPTDATRVKATSDRGFAAATCRTGQRAIAEKLFSPFAGYFAVEGDKDFSVPTGTVGVLADRRHGPLFNLLVLFAP